MQNQGDFKHCASSTDIVKNFAVIKSAIIKRVHYIFLEIPAGSVLLLNVLLFRDQS